MIERKLHDKQHPYLMVSQDILRDRRLSSDERDCLIMMLSNSDDWEFSYSGLAAQLGVKPETAKGRVKKLIDHGYVSVSYPLDTNGKPIPFAKGQWIIRETPIHGIQTLVSKSSIPTAGIQTSVSKEQYPTDSIQPIVSKSCIQRNNIEEPSYNNYQNKDYQNEEYQGERESALTPTPINQSRESIISETDLNIRQAFNKFSADYPNMGDKDAAWNAFVAIPDISNICWQIANSIEWFKKSGKWNNWKTGEENVSCPFASKFLKRGDWEQYMKTGKEETSEERMKRLRRQTEEVNYEVNGWDL